jgi:hypothetical protein
MLNLPPALPFPVRSPSHYAFKMSKFQKLSNFMPAPGPVEGKE